jgi:hypothetical protein
MFKMTNIDSLGVSYNVQDQTGKIIKSIQVIPHTEILDAALGPYTDSFDSFQNYLEKSIEVLEGFEEVDPFNVLWYSTTSDTINLKELIEYAIRHGYNKIIYEQLDPLVDSK